MLLLPRISESGGRQNARQKEFKGSIIDFLCLTYFKLLSQIEGNSLNNCDFFKLIIYVRDDHCDHSPRVLQKVGYAI